MASEPIINNPLGWVHAELQGGWKKAATLGGVYLVLACGLMLLIYRATESNRSTAATSDFTNVAMIILGVIQSLTSTVVVCSAISKAVQKDLSTGMIDSHRLTPIPGWAAVLGYLTGPSINLVPVTVANLIMAETLSVFGGHDLFAPPVAIGLCLCVGFSLASINLLMSICSRKATNVNIIGLIVIMSIFGGGGIVMLVPGLGFLSGFYFGMSMVNTTTGGISRFDPGVVYALGSQFFLALLACIGASRRYLRNDVQAFPPYLALVVLAFFAFEFRVGMMLLPSYSSRLVGAFGGRSGRAGGSDYSVQWIGSIGVLALIAILPITSSILANQRWARHFKLDPESSGPRPPTVPAVFGLTIVISMCFMLIGRGAGWLSLPLYRDDHSPLTAPELVTTAVIFALALLSIAGVAKFVYSFRERVGWYLAFWIFLAWVLPVVADIGRALILEGDENVRPSWLMACSPPGAWGQIFASRGAPVYGGIIVQAALAVLVWYGIPMLQKRPPAARPVVTQAG